MCTYTLAAPFWVAICLTDELLSTPEDKFFGEERPVDIDNTDGTIPTNIGDINYLHELLEELKSFGKELNTKTY